MAMTPPLFNLIRTKDVAKMAFAAITGNSSDEKISAHVFFIPMTNSYPDLALGTLDASIDVLAEISDSADIRVVNGHAAGTALILSVSAQSEKLIHVCAPKLRRFIEFVISKDKHCQIHFSAFWQHHSGLSDWLQGTSS
jgi:hypothetical protein